MATVEKDLDQKQDVVNQSGCCGGFSASEAKEKDKNLDVENVGLSVKVEPKSKEQIRSCCG